MKSNNFLRFLILLVTLSQVYAFSSYNRTADSSSHLERTRRVIDRTPNANTRVRLRDAFYVVNIKRNGIHHCAGSILSAQVIITTCTCVNQNARFTVVSGTVSTIRGGTSHLVTGILRHPLFHPNLYAYDIALLSINPPITFGANINGPIPIFLSNNGQFPTGILVTVSGYGAIYQNRRGGLGCFNAGGGGMRLVNPNELRSIRLPTISLQDCRNRNDNNPIITNQIICTFHDQKSCSAGESGNPLAFSDRLVGVLVSDGFDGGADLYVNVAVPQIRFWIMSRMSRIPTYDPPSAPHHRNPQSCSLIHPCNDTNEVH